MFCNIPVTELQRLKALTYPLLVIASIEAPIGETALAAACQVDRRTAHGWLVALADLGYLQRIKPHNGYTLTPHARACFVENLPKIGEILHNFVQFFPISPSVNDASLSQSNIESLTESAPSNGEKIPKLDDPLPISPEAFASLRSAGIMEPKRSALARLPWMSPDYIAGWKELLSRRKRYSTGLLIHCLESGDPPPAAPVLPSSATPILDRLLSTYNAVSETETFS